MQVRKKKRERESENMENVSFQPRSQDPLLLIRVPGSE